MSTARLYFGDCLESMRAMPAENVDAVVCDPPYELGFMGKSWDASGIAFDPATWREALRVLKPGGYLLAFGGTRTYHRIAVAIEDAGFEIRDSLIWNYGSGFPKSLNVAIAIDKQAGAMGHRGKAITVAGYTPGANLEVAKGAPAHDPITDDAKRWKGWGTALKPAFEPVVVARKPLTKGLTVAGNVLRHGTGALNIDGCRVGTTTRHNPSASNADREAWRMNTTEIDGRDASGRWPANVLFTHAPGCVRVGSQKVKCSNAKYSGEGQGMGGAHGIYSALGARPAGVELGYADAEGKETVAAYECAPGCPVAALDAQSGVSKSTGGRTVTRSGGGNVGSGKASEKAWTNDDPGFGDTGGASRFFTVTEYGEDDLPGAKPGDPPFYYASKASRSEREAGCGDLPGKTAVEAVGRDPESVGAQSPRAGAGRGAGASKPICAECGIDLSGGRAASRCAVSNTGAHVVVNRGDERGALVRNHHPTVKPLSVMRWLCRLVTPPGGIVLDPFMGSGTTGVAALLEGFDFVGCEREADYLLIAEARIAHHAPGARLLGPSDE